jgi:hypothetical protein
LLKPNAIQGYPANATKYLDGSGNWSVPAGGGGGGGGGSNVASFVFAHNGTAVTGVGVSRIPLAAASTITGVTASSNTAPTGASLKFDVNKNGTTIFTTPANRPTLAISANETSAQAVPDVTALAAGDYLTADIDQVGSTVAGADLVVVVYYTTP